MDPISAIVIFLGVLTLMGATLIALLAKVSGQLQALITAYQASINPTDAATIQTAIQGLSDSMTTAGFPPAP